MAQDPENFSPLPPDVAEMLRDVVASNLTVALQMEQLRRAMHPEEHKHAEHPLSTVLQTMDMIRDVLEDDDEIDDVDDLDDDPPDPRMTLPSRPRAGTRTNPFASTLEYVRGRSGTGRERGKK